jgi:hypothetical protein
MTITSLILRFRCRPPIPTIFTPNRHCPFELERSRNQDYIKQLEVPSDTKTYMVLAGTGIVSHTTG